MKASCLLLWLQGALTAAAFWAGAGGPAQTLGFNKAPQSVLVLVLIRQAEGVITSIMVTVTGSSCMLTSSHLAITPLAAALQFLISPMLTPVSSFTFLMSSCSVFSPIMQACLSLPALIKTEKKFSPRAWLSKYCMSLLLDVVLPHVLTMSHWPCLSDHAAANDLAPAPPALGCTKAVLRPALWQMCPQVLQHRPLTGAGQHQNPAHTDLGADPPALPTPSFCFPWFLPPCVSLVPLWFPESLSPLRSMLLMAMLNWHNAVNRGLISYMFLISRDGQMLCKNTVLIYTCNITVYVFGHLH